MCLLRVSQFFIAKGEMMSRGLLLCRSRTILNARHQRPTASPFALHHILWPHIMNSTILVSWFLFLIVTPEFGVAYLPGSISALTPSTSRPDRRHNHFGPWHLTWQYQQPQRHTSSSEINRRSRVVLSVLTRDVNGAVHAPPSEAASGGGKSEYVRDNISGMT
jgi:hypothetical protein